MFCILKGTYNLQRKLSSKRRNELCMMVVYQFFLHNVENIIQLAALISFLLVFTDSVGTIFYFLCVLISKQAFRTNYLDKDWILENALSFLKSKVLNIFSRMFSQSNIDNFDSITMTTMIFINTCKLLMNVSMAL